MTRETATNILRNGVPEAGIGYRRSFVVWPKCGGLGLASDFCFKGHCIDGLDVR